ncbi:MAG: hypothetical protein H6733_03715 [Alphaproteobacteria bacterium]|nr:hypothetical protein [Alphaproteobacteria bacterium]
MTVWPRRVVLRAVLPAPPGWPAWADVDQDAAEATLDAAAPGHLRLGLAVAVLLLGWVLPLLRTGRTLAALDADRRDAVVAWAAALPGVGDLVEIARIVACLVYFDADAVQRHVREVL